MKSTPARFVAEVATTRTLVSRIGTKLGIAPASLSADKAYGSGPLLSSLFAMRALRSIAAVVMHGEFLDRTVLDKFMIDDLRQPEGS